jgi:hypothetical protein
MSSTENLDAARRLLTLAARRGLRRPLCSLRTAAVLHWRDLKDVKTLLDELGN